MTIYYTTFQNPRRLGWTVQNIISNIASHVYGAVYDLLVGSVSAGVIKNLQFQL